jgi:hypothetical protein
MPRSIFREYLILFRIMLEYMVLRCGLDVAETEEEYVWQK